MDLRKIILVAMAILCAIAGAEAKKNQSNARYNILLPTSPENVSQQYGNLDYGIRIQVKSDVSNNGIVNLSELNSKEAQNFPECYLENSIVEAAEQYLDSKASGLGFKVGTSSRTDFILVVTVKELRLRVREYNVKKKQFLSSAACVISWELRNADREQVISANTCTGRAETRSQVGLMLPLNMAFAKALDSIDWDRIASSLKIAKNARQEANAQVSGEGNTALEHTVIRWYITSRPAGADVYWRVVSSTPDVSNTNAAYIGNTPYESTESFDVKGLTYNNSGNVQIEVTCERPGYLPQKKRFNLRQVIDQKEISAMFNLVKEDAE